MQLKFGKYKGYEIEYLMQGNIDLLSYVIWLVENEIPRADLLKAIEAEAKRQKYKDIDDWCKHKEAFIDDCYYQHYKNRSATRERYTKSSVDLSCPDDYFYGYATDYPECF